MLPFCCQPTHSAPALVYISQLPLETLPVSGQFFLNFKLILKCSTMSLPSLTVTVATWTISRNDSMIQIPYISKILNSMCLVISIFGLAGNGIVAFFLGFRIKRNKFTVYILNLAVADFLLLLGAMFLMLYVMVYIVDPQTLEQHPNYNNILKGMSSIIMSCLFGYNTSLYLLTAISVERCMSVLFPIWYKCHRPVHQSAVVCCLLWFLSCLLTTAEFLICKQQKYIAKGHVFLTKYSKQCSSVYVAIDLLCFFICTPLMVFSSVTLLIKVTKVSWKQQSSKLYVVIIVTVVFFLAFAMPMRVMLQVRYWYPSSVPLFAIDVSSILCSINSSINPFVYWFVGRMGVGKGSFHMILKRIFREDNEEHIQKHPRQALGQNKTETVL